MMSLFLLRRGCQELAMGSFDTGLFNSDIAWDSERSL